jgi:hypothetical protein
MAQTSEYQHCGRIVANSEPVLLAASRQANAGPSTSLRFAQDDNAWERVPGSARTRKGIGTCLARLGFAVSFHPGW